MNALSKLLTRVACRIIRNNPTNETLLQIADHVVLWRNADYIGDEQVNEISNSMQDIQTVEVEEPVNEVETEVETPVQTENMFYGMTPEEVIRSLSYRPAKDELHQACDWLGISYDGTETNAVLKKMIYDFAGIEQPAEPIEESGE